MFTKIRQHLCRGTFRFVAAGKRYKLTCKWAFKEKRDVVSGNVFKRKARIVARGFQQRAGIDYMKTCATTAMTTSARVLLSIAAAEGLAMRCANAVGTYLMGGPLKEEICAAYFTRLVEYFVEFAGEGKKYGYTTNSIL